MDTSSFTPEQVKHIRYVKQVISNHAKAMLASKVFEKMSLSYIELKNSVFLTGGAIASLLQNETPKDWDWYFTDDRSQHLIGMYLAGENQQEYIKDVDEKYKEVMGVNGKMITSNAITTVTDDSFITLIFGEPEFVKSSFDYVHTTPHYSPAQDLLFISPRQYYACTHKKLIVNNPESVKTWRTEKFLSRGYTNA